MKQNLLYILGTVFVLTGFATQVMAQEVVSIKELTTYPEPLEVAADISNHPYKDSLVTITGVVQSYPKSSGNRSYDEGDNTIGSIQVFVIDTAAVADGRDGMSMLLNEVNVEALETYTRGDILTITGRLSFYFSSAQFTPESYERIGNVNDEAEFAKFAPLLDPWEVDLSDINISNGDGTFEMNLANYSKYSNAYVKVTGAAISNVAESGGRVDYAVNANGTRIYGYDTSLRFRNDRPSYRKFEGSTADYNWRRAEDGDFNPPNGAIANVSGFITVSGDDPDNVAPSNKELFSLNPFEDGVLWSKDGEGNPLRFVNGVNGFVWPNDFVVTGLPPVVTAFSTSPEGSIIPSNTPVDISLTAEGPEAGITVDSVRVFFQAGEIDSTLLLAKSGDNFTITLPGFDELTAVSYYFEMHGSDGLSGRYPNTGTEGYFVLDEEVTSIDVIQRTGDGQSGDSPIAGSGPIPVNFTATVVADAATDGFISLQDKAAKWSGIFIEVSSETEALVRGDQVLVTEVEVEENYGLTYIKSLEFTVLETANDQLDTLAVSVLTQDITSGAGSEEYEGVFVSLKDVKVLTNQADGGSDYGEWEIGSRQGGTAGVDTLDAGEGLRINDDFDLGSTTIKSYMNEYIRNDAQIDEIKAIVQYSFGNPKLVLRSIEDIQGDNWSIPNNFFDLLGPEEDEAVIADADGTPTWESTSDFDGNALSYEFVLLAADTSVLYTQTADNAGADAQATIPFATVDSLLASLGLEVGDVENFLWTVRISDGLDTTTVSSDYDVESNTFIPYYQPFTLERALQTSIEKSTGIPEKFALKQNYPNPFNPSTQIAFDLPQAAHVKLNVFDMLGRKVATIINERMTAGSHIHSFNASRLASGMYIYRIDAGTFTSTRKMMLIK